MTNLGILPGTTAIWGSSTDPFRPPVVPAVVARFGHPGD